MSFVAVAIGGSAVISGVTSMIAGSKAAGAAQDAANTQAATDRYIFDTARADNAPARTIGNNALGALARLYGVSTNTDGTSTDWGGYVRGNSDALANWNAIKGTSDGAQFNGDINAFGQYHYGADGSRRELTPYNGGSTSSGGGQFGGFIASPGYQFRLSEGMKAIERSAAARGGLRSGATMKALNDYAGGSASAEWGQYVGALGALAGIGQSANQANQQAGQVYAQNSAATNANLGNARASAYANTGNAINSTVGNLASAYLYSKGYGGLG